MPGSLGEKLRELRGSMSFREAASKTGLSHTYIKQLENGIDPRSGKEIFPSLPVLEQIADGYGIPREELLVIVGYLKSDSENPRKDESPIDMPSKKSDNSTYTQWNREHSEKVISIALERMRKETDFDSDIAMIPVLGTIKAGYDLYADQQVIDVQPVAKATVADGAEYFYLVVKGNSMIGDGIREGMRVLVRRQEYVEDGKVGVVLINGDEATLKRVYRRDDELMLISSNPEFPPRSVHISEARIQGQIKQVVWDFE